MGQLQYFIGMVSGGVMNGLRNGVIRRTAELAGEPDRRAVHVSSVMKTVVCVGVAIAVSVIIFSEWLAKELLQDASRATPLTIFGATYVLGLIGGLMLACAAGAKSYATSAVATMANGVISVILFAALCPWFGLNGALVALAMMPFANFLVIAAYARKSTWWPRDLWRRRFEAPEAYRAVAFIPAATITSIGTPLVHIVLRDDLAAAAGIEAVGLLHGVTRLSDMGASLLWGLFGLYFAPRFAELRFKEDVKREVWRATLLFMPALITFSLLVYFFRDELIPLIFTKEFAAMRDLFAWQLVGTCLRIFGGTFGLVMMAKANPLFIGAYEAFTLFVWLVAGKLLIQWNGAVGATQAFALNYAVYAGIVILMSVLVIRRLPSR
jgi:PST family polysaccharide transporter